MKHLILLTSLLTFSSAFAAESPTSKYENIQAMYTAINNLAASSRECTTDEDCTVIALGSRSCGGPNDFTFTSKNNPNLETIETLAETLREQEDTYNLNHDVVSICLMEPAPRIECQASVCVEN